MKLNNRGWGLAAFLGFTIVFMVFLLIAFVKAYDLGISTENPGIQFGPNNNQNNNTNPEGNNGESSVSGRDKYRDLESKIISASSNYRLRYYSNLLVGDSVYVPFKTLIANNYLTTSGDCSGYVKIYQRDKGNYEYTVYFNCPDYVTSGYLQDLDK